MLYAESLAYTQPTSDEKHHLNVPELLQIGAIAGHNVLNFLDLKLKSDSLRSSSKHDLEALFLLLVGTILAVGYSYPNKSAENPNSLSNATSDSSEFQAMQSHLCQILAHYMVYIGSRLNLPIANDADRFILEAAPKRWHKEGIFRWLTASEHRQQREDVLPHSVDAKCNNSKICARSNTNGIFTLARVEIQNAMATHAYEPSFSNSVGGSCLYNILDISNPESAARQPNSSSSTNLAQSSRSSESMNKNLTAAVSNPFDLSSESTYPGNSPRRLWNISSQVEYESFSLLEDYRIFKPLSVSEPHNEHRRVGCDVGFVKGRGFAYLSSCSTASERERAVLEETQNLLV